MKVTLYMVMSFDGVVALDSERDISAFSSVEDKKFFLRGAKKCSAVLMGKNTARQLIKGPVNFILTHKPEGGTDFTGGTKCVYICKSAREAYDAIASQGHKSLALLGGPSTNIQFLKEGLVDEIFLTVEPVTIGRGLHFLEGAFESRWKLCGVKKLNARGSLVLHYKKAA